jgi:hypothetical protein
MPSGNMPFVSGDCAERFAYRGWSFWRLYQIQTGAECGTGDRSNTARRYKRQDGGFTKATKTAKHREVSAMLQPVAGFIVAVRHIPVHPLRPHQKKARNEIIFCLLLQPLDNFQRFTFSSCYLLT